MSISSIMELIYRLCLVIASFFGLLLGAWGVGYMFTVGRLAATRAFALKYGKTEA